MLIERKCLEKKRPRFGHSDGPPKRAGYEKGGPEGPPLLCGIIQAGWQAAMPEQFFQAQAFWKTSSPSRTSIRTA